MSVKKIHPALPYSYEDFFHPLNFFNFLINFRTNEQAKKLIPKEFLERAIGVIYLPEAEQDSHYFYANGEVCETFPSGL